MIIKEDTNDPAITILTVYNYIDSEINNLQTTIVDSSGTTIGTLTEAVVYTDTPDIGIKRMVLPTYEIMLGLAAGGTITISYEAPSGHIEMTGFPQMFFMKQIESCPRLKEVLEQALGD